MPPGSGVPVPGANAGIEHVDVDREEHRAVADDLRPSRSTTASMPRSRTSCMKNDVIPCSRLPRELRLARPVAAQPDLHVALRVDDAVPHEPVHRRAVRDLDAEHLRARVGVRVEVDEADGTVRRAHARTSGSAIEWSPPRTIGSSAGVDDLADRRARSPRACARRPRAAPARRRSRRSAAPRTRRPSSRGAGPGGQLAARIARGPKRAPGRSETRSSVGAPTIATSKPASSAGSCV